MAPPARDPEGHERSIPTELAERVNELERRTDELRRQLADIQRESLDQSATSAGIVLQAMWVGGAAWFAILSMWLPWVSESTITLWAIAGGRFESLTGPGFIAAGAILFAGLVAVIVSASEGGSAGFVGTAVCSAALASVLFVTLRIGDFTPTVFGSEETHYRPGPGAGLAISSLVILILGCLASTAGTRNGRRT